MKMPPLASGLQTAMRMKRLLGRLLDRARLSTLQGVI